VPPPYAHTPSDEDFYVRDPRTGITKPNLALLKDHFIHEGRLTESQALFILHEATNVLRSEPNLMHLNGPITVCGDIHGQFYDLLKIFDIGGDFAETNYLFLGDYVDRGCFGIECLLYLYALKLWHPATLFLLRGNHECRNLTEYFTFKRECTHKYSETIYEACIESFQALPLTALIDGKFFCVHGGISPQLQTLADLNQVNRFTEPASTGLLCDLLWADPFPNFGNEQEPTFERPRGIPPGMLFDDNTVRGCSYNFSYEAACKFLERNRLLGIFRGHEVQDAGYVMHRRTPHKKFPSVITVFSAPNYIDLYHNRGAIIKYKNRNITIRQFNAQPHPYWLPNFMDAFTWSLPFVGAKITEMLLAMLNAFADDESSIGDADEDDTRTVASSAEYAPVQDLNERRQQIKTKIMAVGKMQRVFQLLREEAENATELTTAAPTPVPTPTGVPSPSSSSWPGGFSLSSLPQPDALGVHVNELRRYIRSFDDARRSDLANERLPTYTPPSIPLVSAPSMKFPSGSEGDGVPHGQDLNALVKKVLEEEGMDDDVMANRIAEKIIRANKPSERPGRMRRYDTVA
ncbi:Metallo-dependent phosphatase, partial [Panus rudis PR-1116 ss-1]